MVSRRDEKHYPVVEQSDTRCSAILLPAPRSLTFHLIQHHRRGGGHIQ